MLELVYDLLKERKFISDHRFIRTRSIRISNKLACIQVVQIVLYGFSFSFMVAVQSNSFKCKLYFIVEPHFKLLFFIRQTIVLDENCKHGRQINFIRNSLYSFYCRRCFFSYFHIFYLK